MSTIVCQGLQSCLEPQLKETTTLRLKLAALKSIGLGSRGPCLLDSSSSSSNTKEVREKCHNENTKNQMAANLDSGGWNFLQSLSNSSQSPKNAMDIESSYIHPKVKPYPSLRLSEKSLELCTENLGSETGSDISEGSIFSFSSLESRSEKLPTRERQNSSQHSATKKANSHSFPPPLTTISGSNSLQVRPHREGGRLIIKAVEAPSTRTCFEAERSDGRLQLKFLKNCELYFEQKVTPEENEEGSENDRIDEFENDSNNEENQEEGGEIFEEREDEERNGAHLNILEEENGAYMNKDMDGNSIDVDVEMGMEKFQRPIRCKEGGHGADKGLYNWEPFWVATS